MLKRIACTALVLAAVGMLPAAAVAGPPPLARLTSIGVGPTPDFGMADMNGSIYLVSQTTAPGSSAPDGLAMTTITASGHVLGPVQALSGWTPGRPGLIAVSNTLEAFFGATSPGPNPVSGVWEITSSDFGKTWSAPTNAGNGGTIEAGAYAADVTAQLSGSTPFLTLPWAGGLVVQQGLGAGSSAALVTNAGDNFAIDVNSAVDAASGEVVAGWQSLAGSGGEWLQGVGPTAGAAQHVPGQNRNQLVVAGRDKGSGVFAAYTPDNTHVRLLRYGGGSVAVGSAHGLGADVLGVASGPSGRIWVMWGDSHGIAVTRSNKAVTRFEPIQRLGYASTTLYRLAGDGLYDTLRLLVDEIPSTGGQIPGTFYKAVLPELSAHASAKSLKNKKGKVVGHEVKVVVTDAGDPVAKAKVSVAGHQVVANGSGVATVTLPASASGKLAVKVTAPGYRTLKTSVHV